MRAASLRADAAAAGPGAFVLSIPTTATSRSVMSLAPLRSRMSARRGQVRARVRLSSERRSGATTRGLHVACHASSTRLRSTCVVYDHRTGAADEDAAEDVADGVAASVVGAADDDAADDDAADDAAGEVRSHVVAR